MTSEWLPRVRCLSIVGRKKNRDKYWNSLKTAKTHSTIDRLLCSVDLHISIALRVLIKTTIASSKQSELTND